MASRYSRSMLALALMAGCAHAQADDLSAAAPDAVWRCWWDQATHISCAGDQFLHIPMHNYPFEMESVAVLARSVMCGGKPRCEVRFTKDLPDAVELDRLMDPLLASGQ